MTKPTVTVSDHALVRYMERVLGVDLMSYRLAIQDICDGPSKAGANCVSSGGFTFHLKNDVVTTIVKGASPTRSRLRIIKRSYKELAE